MFFVFKRRHIIEKKPGITSIVGAEAYRNLITYKMIDELNTTVRIYTGKFAGHLNKNKLAVLVHLQDYSAKFLLYLLEQ
ncbi:hypothetical protein CON35_25000 [Bacillus cereus]|nr:hypothetical protein CON35_25000 [Bacillus cereus]